MKRETAQGFTVTELLVVIALMSIIIGIAVPSISDMVSRNALKNGAKTLQGDFMNMRTAARVRQQSVIATINADGTYSAYADVNNSHSVDAGDVLLVSNNLSPLQLQVEGLSLPANLTFTSVGSITVQTKIVITHPRWGAMQYRLIANTTGLLKMQRSIDGGVSWMTAW